MFHKVNLTIICRHHLRTLINTGEERVSRSQVFLFFVAPIIASALILYFFSTLDDRFIEILITAMSILTGLLFNLIVLLYDIINKTNDDFQKLELLGNKLDAGKKKIRIDFLRHIFSNISFGILLALVSIPFLVVGLSHNKYLKLSADFVALSLLLMFFLLMMMILKRVHILLAKEFQK